jgi:hypothetical protein
MRRGTIAAALGALLFAAYDAQAAPAVNLKGAMQSPAGSVDLVRQGGGGKGGPGKGLAAADPSSAESRGLKMSVPAETNMGAYNGGPHAPKAAKRQRPPCIGLRAAGGYAKGIHRHYRYPVRPSG